ncbi:MAG: hypothetical protein ACOCUI_00040 [bacterium]
MITINKHVRNILINNTSITNIVDDKIYSLFIPDSSIDAPFVLLNRLDNNRNYVKDTPESDLINFSVVCVHTDYVSVIELAELVDNALDNYKFNETNFKGQIRQNDIKEAFTGEYMIDLEYIIRIKYK